MQVRCICESCGKQLQGTFKSHGSHMFVLMFVLHCHYAAAPDQLTNLAMRNCRGSMTCTRVSQQLKLAQQWSSQQYQDLFRQQPCWAHSSRRNHWPQLQLYRCHETLPSTGRSMDTPAPWLRKGPSSGHHSCWLKQACPMLMVSDDAMGKVNLSPMNNSATALEGQWNSAALMPIFTH